MSHMRWQILLFTTLVELLRPPRASDSLLRDIQQKVTGLSACVGEPVCPPSDICRSGPTFGAGFALGGLAWHGYWLVANCCCRRRPATPAPRRRGSGVLMDARAERANLVLR